MEFSLRWSTTKTAAGKSRGRPRTRSRKASTPPAEAPTTIRSRRVPRSAGQDIGCAVRAASRPGRWRRGTAAEEVVQGGDGVGEAQDAVVVGVRGVIAEEGRAAGEEARQEDDGVVDLESPIAVG